MTFEWDPRKAVSNRRKHGVSFEMAARVFLDPNRIEVLDNREEYGEDRRITIGMVEPAILAVIYTVRGKNGETIRLISARRANEKETGAYGQVRS